VALLLLCGGSRHVGWGGQLTGVASLLVEHVSTRLANTSLLANVVDKRVELLSEWNLFAKTILNFKHTIIP